MRERQAVDCTRSRDRAPGLSAPADAHHRLSPPALDAQDLRDGHEARPAQDAGVLLEREGLRPLRQAVTRRRAVPLPEGARAGEQGDAPPGLASRTHARDAVQEGRTAAHMGAGRQHDALLEGRVPQAEGLRGARSSDRMEVRAPPAVERARRPNSEGPHSHLQERRPPPADPALESGMHFDGGERAAQPDVDPVSAGPGEGHSRARSNQALAASENET